VISLKRSNNNVGLVDGSSCDCMSTCLYISLFVHVGNEPEPDTGPRRERERERERERAETVVVGT
jgi:hypothetical protein